MSVDWYCVALCVFGVFIMAANGDIVLQNNQYCGSNTQPKEERVEGESELNVYSHAGREFYAPARDCVLIIIGDKYHQWEVEIVILDVDAFPCRHSEPCCNDYLKLFNAYTVDNARLFPSIPWRGLCGTGLPKKRLFVSTQNHITIQFNVDHLSDSKRGFQLRLKQYPRRSAGTDFLGTGIGGWNDGSLNELQIDWQEQVEVPGDYRPGEDPTFEYDPNGVSCYVCKNCKRDYFESSDIGVTKSKGCYVCSKEWLQGSASATRHCLSRKWYESRMLSLRDISSGEQVNTDFRSCKVFSRIGTSTSATYINVCICDSNNCNHATLICPHFTFGILILFVTVLLNVKSIL